MVFFGKRRSAMAAIVMAGCVTASGLAEPAKQLTTEDYAQAEKLHREVLGIDRRVLGPDHPDSIDALEILAVDLSHEGRFSEAATLFREALQAAEKSNLPTIAANTWYDFACGAALAGRRSEALEYLRQAIDHGLTNPDSIPADPDLKSLHSDPGFNALVTKARKASAPRAK